MEQRLLNVKGALSSEVPTTLHLEPGMPEPANPGLLQEEAAVWPPEGSAGHHISEIASSNVSVGPFMGMPSVESPAALSAGVLSRPLQPQHSWSDVPAAQGLSASLQPNSSPVPARPAQPGQMTGTTGSLVQQQWSSNDAPGAAGSAGPPRHASPADVRAGDNTSKLAGHADLAEMWNTAGASLADVENTEGASQGAGSAQLMEQQLLNVEGASSTEVPTTLHLEPGMPEPANPGLLQEEPLAWRPESSAGHHISEIASSNVSVGPFMGMPAVESPAALSAGVLSRPLQPQHSWSDVPAAQGLSASLQPISSTAPARHAQPGQMTGTTGSLVQQQWSSNDAPGAAGSTQPPRRASPADVRVGDNTSKLAGHADLAEMRNTAGASLADVENTEGASQGAGSAQLMEQQLLNAECASSTEVPKALRSEPGMPEPANPGLLQEEPLAWRPESSAGHHISEIASSNVSVGPFMGMPSVESLAALSAGVLSRPLQPHVPAAQGLSASLQPNSSPVPARPAQPGQMTGTTRSLVQQQWSSHDAPGAAGSAGPPRHASPADVRAGDSTSKLAGHADLAEMRNTAGASLADVENTEGASQGAGSAQLMEQRLLNVKGALSSEVSTTLHLEPGMPEPANPGLLQEEPLAWRPESSAGHHISEIASSNVSVGPFMGMPSVESPAALSAGVLSRPLQPQHSWSDVPAAQGLSASLQPNSSPVPARPGQPGQMTGTTRSLVQQQWSSNDAPGAAGSTQPPRHASPADVRAGDNTSKLAGHADLAEMRNTAGASLADVENTEGASQAAGSAQLMEQRLLNVKGALSSEVSTTRHLEPGMPEPANPGLLQEEPLAWRPESSAGHHISEIASSNVSVGPFTGMPSVESPAALSAGVLSRPLQPQHSWSDVPAAQGLSASLQPNSSPVPARPAQPGQMTGTTGSLVQQQWSSNDAPGAAGSTQPPRRASPADVRAGDNTSKLAGHADLAEMRNTAGASLADVENREGASQGAGSAQLMDQRLLNVEGASSTEVPKALRSERGMPEPANPGLLQEEPLAWRPESSAGHHISEIASSNVSVGPFMGMPLAKSPAALSAGVLSRPLQPQHSWSDVPAAQGLSASLQPISSTAPARHAQAGQMTGTTGSLVQQQWSSNDAPGAAGSTQPPRHASPADVRAGDNSSKLAGHADLAEMRNTAGASLADVENTEGASQGAGSAQLMEQQLLNVEGASSTEVPKALRSEPGMPEPANPGLLQEEAAVWPPQGSAGHHISEIASSNVSVGPFMGMPLAKSPAALSAGVLSRPLQPQHSWSDVPAAQGFQPISSTAPARHAQAGQMTGTTGSLVQQQWSSNDAPGAAGSTQPPRHACFVEFQAGDGPGQPVAAYVPFSTEAFRIGPAINVIGSSRSRVPLQEQAGGRSQQGVGRIGSGDAASERVSAQSRNSQTLEAGELGGLSGLSVSFGEAEGPESAEGRLPTFACLQPALFSEHTAELPKTESLSTVSTSEADSHTGRPAQERAVPVGRMTQAGRSTSVTSPGSH